MYSKRANNRPNVSKAETRMATPQVIRERARLALKRSLVRDPDGNELELVGL